MPETGPLGQYAHPNLLTVIFCIERQWQTICDRKFGIGNISLDGGKTFKPHKTHRSGIEVDCRPVRKDHLTGQVARCSYHDKTVYDCVATTKLIELFTQHPWVRLVYFNDPDVQRAVGRVSSCVNHNDHFHIELWPRFAS